MTKERLVDRTPQLLCPSGGIIWGAPTGLPSIPQREQAQFNHSSHLLDAKLFMGFLSYPNLPTFLLLFPRMTLNKSLVLESLSHSMLQRETKQRQHLFLLWPVLAIFVFLGEISEAWKPKSQRNLSLKYSHFLLLILQLKPIINFPLIKYSDSPPPHDSSCSLAGRDHSQTIFEKVRELALTQPILLGSYLESASFSAQNCFI